MLSPVGVDIRQCASEEAEPRKVWTPCVLSARTLGPKVGGLRFPHRLGRGMSSSENAGPEEGGS